MSNEFNLDNKIDELYKALSNIVQRHSRVKFANSLGAEDMVITHAIVLLNLPIEIFLLNTLRLHPETLALVEKINQSYGVLLKEYFPNAALVDEYVQQFGENAFYESVALRKKCCAIRKVEPLARALSDAQAWITGQRRDQSITRHQLALEEYDENHQIQKYNPLADWHYEEIWSYLKRFDVPTNALHQKGYPSIGCDPCTRAIRPGEDLRAGRWWWEKKETKECGLHVR